MLELIISSLITGMIAGASAALGMYAVWKWFEWREKCEDA